LRAKETRLRRVESEAAQARACVDAHREEETRICTELKELEAATASLSLQVKRFTAQAARRNAREQKENERARGLRATIEFSAQRESAAGRRLCELKAALEQCVENETLALEAATTERRLEELRRRKARLQADIERNGEERGALRDAVTRARARIAERSNLLSLLQAARGSLAEGRRELQSEQAQVARLQAVASHMEAELFDASLSLRTRGAPAATLSPSPPRAHAQATRPRLPLARPAPPLSRGGGGGGGGKASLVDYW
jgi:chromosome segregation ATPase